MLLARNLLFLLVLIPAVFSTSVQASVLPKVSYYVVSQDVRSVMNDMSKILDLPMSVAPDVKGKATAGRYVGTAIEVLDALCRDLGLHRFYDGNTLYVTKASSAVTKVLDGTMINLTELNEGLHNVGINTEQFPLREDKNRGVVVLYGPPRYAAIVETVADRLVSSKQRSMPSVLRGR